MAGATDGSPRGKGVSIPGQPTEEAVAEVGSEAGKSLIRGLGKLASASTSEWAAKREARAEAARIAIETDTRIKTDAALATARREQEVAEFDHQAALERRAARLRIELAREQLNLEAVERCAIEYTEGDPGNSKSRELDEDWLFKFADLAQKVSDKDVQALWGRALSSAAIEGAPTLSAAALQTLGLFDATISESFRKFAAVVSRMRRFPHLADGEKELQDIDLGRLFDLGLITEETHKGPIELEDFSFGLERTSNLGLPRLQSHLGLTRRGYDIAVAVFRAEDDMPLSEELEQQYLRLILQDQVRQLRNAAIVTKLEHVDPPIIIDVTRKTSVPDGVEQFDWKSSDEFGMLNDRLKKLLLSMERDYDVKLSRPPKDLRLQSEAILQKSLTALVALILLPQVALPSRAADDNDPIVKFYFSFEKDARDHLEKFEEAAAAERKRKKNASETALTPERQALGMRAGKELIYNKVLFFPLCAEEMGSATGKSFDQAKKDLMQCVNRKQDELFEMSKLEDYISVVGERNFLACQIKARDFKSERRFPPFEFLRDPQGIMSIDYGKFNVCVKSYL